MISQSDGSGRGLIRSNITVCTRKDWGKQRKTSARIIGVPAEIPIVHLPNIRRQHCRSSQLPQSQQIAKNNFLHSDVGVKCPLLLWGKKTLQTLEKETSQENIWTYEGWSKWTAKDVKITLGRIFRLRGQEGSQTDSWLCPIAGFTMSASLSFRVCLSQCYSATQLRVD